MWSPVGVTPILSTPVYRQHHSSLSLTFMSPKRKKFRFFFTIQRDGFLAEHLIFWLTLLYRKVRKKVILVWDNLKAHKTAEAFFKIHHPDWFHFAYLPPYSPEVNPTESCWSHMKTVSLANSVPFTSDELIASALRSARRIDSDTELIKSFFRHAGLKL